MSELLHEASLCELGVDWAGHCLPGSSDMRVSSQSLESIWNCQNLAGQTSTRRGCVLAGSHYLSAWREKQVSATGGGDRTLLALTPSSSYAPTRRQAIWPIALLLRCHSFSRGTREERGKGQKEGNLLNGFVPARFPWGKLPRLPPATNKNI